MIEYQKKSFDIYQLKRSMQPEQEKYIWTPDYKYCSKWKTDITKAKKEVGFGSLSKNKGKKVIKQDLNAI